MIPFSTIHRDMSGQSLAGIIQLLVIIGLIVGTVLLGGEIKRNANTIMVINRVKAYDTATRHFIGAYSAIPGDITNPKARIPNCTTMPCAASGNGNKIVADRKPLLSTNYFFRDTSENRTFWLHLAMGGFISDIKKEATQGKYFGQWGVEFPKAPPGVTGGFHIAYYSVTATGFNPVSLMGHYMVLRGSTDTYGVTVAPFVFRPQTARMIDAKIDDGKALTGRVIAPGSAKCSAKDGTYNEEIDSKECNLLFQLSF